ncbi:acyltransferase family protein [Jiulongibacter sp. NS-SX5]|uniref:acyltransferase family protein n=1 Tax=Jiulongibacter sp. NS-SX5 TaxID=3463854 RepID=UPI0040593403
MKERLISVDVFRGLTVMLMTLVNNPGDWGNVYPPLLHASWHGCTPTDLVFPFFLFIVGVTTVLASPADGSKPDITKIFIRALRIFGLGLYLNFFSKIQLFGLEGYALLAVRLLITAVVVYLLLTKYEKRLQLISAVAVVGLMFFLAYGFEHFQNVRIPGVLQRIAIVYLIVSLLYRSLSLKMIAFIGLVLLLGYWAAMMLIPVNGELGNLEANENVAAMIDRVFLSGHMWSQSKTWDPEGLFSTLPAIGTGILGLFAGLIISGRLLKDKKWRTLLYAGFALVLFGYLWHQVFPINKALWTSTFVLFTAGLACVSLVLIQFIAEKTKGEQWATPFLIFGVNPMLVFFFSGIIPRVLSSIKVGDQGLQGYIYDHVLGFISDPKLHSLSWALFYLVFWSLILLWFWRKKIYVKV